MDATSGGGSTEHLVKELTQKVQTLSEQCAASQELLLSSQKQLAMLTEAVVAKGTVSNAEKKESVHVTNSKLDLNGDGVIEEWEIEAAEKNVSFLKKELWLALAAIVFLLVSVFSMSFIAVELSKELHTLDAALTTSNGTMILTRAGSSFVTSVSAKGARRLTEEGGEVKEAYKLGMAYSEVLDIISRYNDGESSFILELDDGSHRTMLLEGYYQPESDNEDIQYYQAFGLCSSCTQGEVRWILDCMQWSVTQERLSCTIEYWYTEIVDIELDNSERRLQISNEPSRETEARKLADEMLRRRLAEDPVNGGFSDVEEAEEAVTMDRTLSAKACAR
eukprot:TRINITY_DN64310_c0_g1_i1.p1 TRINITY_DN64310_c0_g1~~TRINITY_DN64310_c0_g1_i1.p1  ORF type:complete len:352 (+),score=78.22 TRINITY_DN64310_c0_g1_i1:53-1057(+)